MQTVTTKHCLGLPTVHLPPAFLSVTGTFSLQGPGHNSGCEQQQELGVTDKLSGKTLPIYVFFLDFRCSPRQQTHTLPL
jgi:hypothetical protein